MGCLGIDKENGIVVEVGGSVGGWPIDFKLGSWNATTGQLICNGTDIGLFSSESPRDIDIADGKVYCHFMDGCTRAISIYTGQVVWKSDPADMPWGAIGTYGGISCGYGNVYTGTEDGYIYCYNGDTGKTVWKYFCGNTTANGFGHYVPFGYRILADGKVYCSTGEHTPPNPPPRGYELLCLDAYTGKLIWSYPCMVNRDCGAGAGVSSGMFWIPSAYDNCLYMFGKGESATTVSATPGVMANGASVLIQGTVTDQSSGVQSSPLPYATSAISDERMSDWMAYLYNQWPMPTNATGVTVHLQAMLSDGTVIDIAHVTSDIMGHYGYLWTPPAQDTYKILASFEGSDSYWASSAQTDLGVTAAAPTPAAPVAAPENTPIFAGIIAAIVVVAILVVYLIVTVRKQRK